MFLCKSSKMPAISKIIEMLEERKYKFSELQRILQIERKDLENYLKKIEKICRKKGKRLVIIPARCLKCGYTFKGIHLPSKCPKCRSEWIEEPIFYIE